jgi:hypothetical protein
MSCACSYSSMSSAEASLHPNVAALWARSGA